LNRAAGPATETAMEMATAAAVVAAVAEDVERRDP